MNRVALFITYRMQPGERGAYHRAFDEIARPRIEENPEVELFVRCDDDADDRAVHLFELYRDQAALDRVGDAPWLADFSAAIAPVLSGPADVVMARPVWSKETSVATVDMASEPPPLGLHVKYTVREGGRAAIRAAWEERVKPHIEAADSIRFFFWCEGHDPATLCLFELYQDRAVLDTAAATDWFQAYRETVDPHIARRWFARSSAVWVKGS